MISLSNRGFPMLQAFADAKSDFYMSIDAAKSFDQRPFRSMLVRKYIVYRPGRGFHITKEGREAYQVFMSTDITRKDPAKPLTAYFDPIAYGLAAPKKRVKKEAA